MDAHLRAGVAIHNAGHHHAAHDAWEDHWLDLDSDTEDERLLHGLIQFTAAVHHGYGGNWEGLVGLAESARAYLDGLPADYRGVNVEAVRSYLAALAADPELVERRPPLALTVDGEAVGLADLDPEATFVASEVLAEEFGYDEAAVADAVRFAREDVADGTDSRFLALLVDFVREEEQRALVHDRLTAHVERRRAREADVEGLFDPGE